MYSKIFRRFLYPLSNIASGQKIHVYQKYLLKSQWLDREEIETDQTNNLLNLLSIAAKNTNFYKNKDINFNQLKSDQFFEKFINSYPIVSKTDFRKKRADFLTSLDNPIDKYTSGSTGTPFHFQKGKKANEMGIAATIRGWEWGGFKLGDKNLMIAAEEAKWKKQIWNLINRTSYYGWISKSVNEENLIQILNVLERKKIKHLRSYAAMIFLLAQAQKKYNKDIHLKSIFSTGDKLYPKYRKSAEEAFNCEVYDGYGLVECYSVAFECEEHNLHVSEELHKVEIVDDKGLKLPNNTMGNIVITDLHNFSLPIIRYKTGDLGRFIQTKCKCGRQLQIIEEIQGRDSDIIVTPNGNNLIVHHFTVFFEYLHEDVKEFQVVQNEVNSINIKIVPTRELNSSRIEHIKTGLEELIQDSEVRIDIDIVETIPMSNNLKRRFVIRNF